MSARHRATSARHSAGMGAPRVKATRDCETAGHSTSRRRATEARHPRNRRSDPTSREVARADRATPRETAGQSMRATAPYYVVTAMWRGHLRDVAGRAPRSTP